VNERDAFRAFCAFAWAQRARRLYAHPAAIAVFASGLFVGCLGSFPGDFLFSSSAITGENILAFRSFYF
jgi:hypothetical protein